MKRTYFLIALSATLILLSSCAISYKMSGSNVDYTKTKTISIADFPNNAEMVNPTLSQTFTEALRDKYTRQTRLRVLKQGGDLQIEGEIVGYQLASMSISADSYASQTRLTLTINVRFTNTKNPDEDFETKYSAYQVFDSNRMLNEVEPELIKTMTEEIIDKIFNDTVAKW